MAKTLRVNTASGFITKGAPLLNSELDQNFVDLYTDTLNKVSKTGDTLTGKLNFVAASASIASANIPVGNTPLTPLNGDVWATSSGLFYTLSGLNKNVLFTDGTHTGGVVDTCTLTSNTIGNTNTAALRFTQFSLQDAADATARVAFISTPATGTTATITLPSVTQTLVGTTLTQTLQNKTLTTPTINGGTLSGTFTGNTTITGQTTFTDATAPIITARIGPTTGQQHILPTVASDTITLNNATQALTGKTLNGYTFSVSPNIATPSFLNISVGNNAVNFGGIFTKTISSNGNTSVVLPISSGGTLATLDGTETFTNKTINNSSIGATNPGTGSFTTLTASGETTTARLTFRGYAEGTTSVTASTASTSLSIATASTIRLALNTSTTISFAGTVATANTSQSFTVIVTNGAAGLTLTWPAGTKYPNGTLPTRTTASGAVDIWVFITPDNGTTWYGNLTFKDVK